MTQPDEKEKVEGIKLIRHIETGITVRIDELETTKKFSKYVGTPHDKFEEPLIQSILVPEEFIELSKYECLDVDFTVDELYALKTSLTISHGISSGSTTLLGASAIPLYRKIDDLIMKAIKKLK